MQLLTLTLSSPQIRHLAHIGVCDEREIGLLMESNGVSNTKLPYHPLSAAIPTKDEVMHKIPFFQVSVCMCVDDA